MTDLTHASARVRWARLRFSIVGPLLTCPPDAGELGDHFAQLASRRWQHPTDGGSKRYGASTIERWYYAARNATQDPIEALARKVPSHARTRPSMGAPLRQALAMQYRAHPSWTYVLHHENLVALAKEDAKLGSVPSPATISRHMRHEGFVKQRRRRKKHGELVTFEARERRSFEVTHVHALWHSDFHDGSRSVVLDDGSWKKPFLLAFTDDASRLVCHAQWYLEQTTETFVHGLSQAILKRGLPRALLTDSGSPMVAAETTEGFARLSIVAPHCLAQIATGRRSLPHRICYRPPVAIWGGNDMQKKLSPQTRTELVTTISASYESSTRAEKGRILDEFERVTGYHRKHAIRLLGADASALVGDAAALPAPKATRAKVYDDGFVAVLVVLWEAADRISGKRLVPLLPVLLPAL